MLYVFLILLNTEMFNSFKYLNIVLVNKRKGESELRHVFMFIFVYLVYDVMFMNIHNYNMVPTVTSVCSLSIQYLEFDVVAASGLYKKLASG